MLSKEAGSFSPKYVTSWISMELKAKLQSKTSQWGIIIKAPTPCVALLWLLSLGRASTGLTANSKLQQEEGEKEDLISRRPLALTLIPDTPSSAVRKVATAFSEVKLPCFLPASGALPLPPSKAPFLCSVCCSSPAASPESGLEQLRPSRRRPSASPDPQSWSLSLLKLYWHFLNS